MLLLLADHGGVVQGKKSGRSSASRSASRASPSSRRPPPASRTKRPPPSYEDDVYDEDVDEEEDVLFDPAGDEQDLYDDEEEDFPPPSRRRSGSSTKRPSSASSRTARNAAMHGANRKRPSRYDEEDDYGRGRPRSGRGGRRGPPPRGGRPGGRGSVVPYGRGGPAPGSAFTRGISALKNTMPDLETVKNAASSSIKVARETTSSLSSNLYREVKGLTSSELEQVMLKATRPDDTPVKGKHVERLVGVTYQISARYDIYDAVLRKLWSKMAEKDWRTTIKALYILHRFSADGAPDHAPSLKARLRELRRTRDPKRKDKYFNSKQLLAGDSSPENIKFRAFMSRYAHYVLLRAQCFGGMFDEISSVPKTPDSKKKTGKSSGPKPITATSLRSEHLEAAAMLLKAGVACQLKDGEECENTAIAAERVASDLIGLNTAVAIALNRALKNADNLKTADHALLKKWCEFYKDELQPQTKAMVKKTSPKLDAYGLFLPSRMGTTVSPEVLEKGLNLDGSSASTETDGTEEVGEEEAEDIQEESPEAAAEEESDAAAPEVDEEESDEEDAVEEAAEVDDEYEYEDDEYYDDEEY